MVGLEEACRERRAIQPRLLGWLSGSVCFFRLTECRGDRSVWWTYQGSHPRALSSRGDGKHMLDSFLLRHSRTSISFQSSWGRELWWMSTHTLRLSAALPFDQSEHPDSLKEVWCVIALCFIWFAGDKQCVWSKEVSLYSPIIIMDAENIGAPYSESTCKCQSAAHQRILKVNEVCINDIFTTNNRAK